MINAVERRAGPSGRGECPHSDQSSSFSSHKQTSLWATPRACERGTIDIEFRLSETARGDYPTRVGHLLQSGLGIEEIVDLIT